MTKILITGGTGMVGRAVYNKLIGEGWLENDVLAVSSRDVDLTNYDSTLDFIQKHKPLIVIHLAADVGGVQYNINNNADIFSNNIRINTNVLDACAETGIHKIISLLSTCIYPKRIHSYPILEEYLHEGEPHPSNAGYAYAKRMLEVHSRLLHELASPHVCLIPTNLYGPHDNFHMYSGHFIPAAIHKIYNAKKKNEPEVVFWGDGTQLRQFTYVTDVAHVIYWVLENYYESQPLNVGNTEEYSIETVINEIVKYFGYQGKIIFDDSKPSGQYRKPVSIRKLRKAGYTRKFTSLAWGIIQTCRWFEQNYPDIRGVKYR